MSVPKSEVMTLDQIVEKFGPPLIRGLNLADDKDKQVLEGLKKLSYSDAKDFMKYIESYMDPIKRYELIQVLIKSNEAKDKSGEFQLATFIRGNSAGRGFFSAYQDVSQLDENITSFLQLDPKCVRGVFNKIPGVIYQHYRDFNIPDDAIADNFLFNFLTPLNLAYLNLKEDKRSDYSLAIYILKGGVPSDNPDGGYQRTINSLEAKIERDPTKLIELKKLYARAKNDSLSLATVAGSDVKLLEQLKQFEELDKKKELGQKFYQEMQEEKKAIINRYKEFKAGQYKDVSPERSTQEQHNPQKKQEERLQKFDEDLPKIKQAIIEKAKAKDQAKDQKTPSKPKEQDVLIKKSGASDGEIKPVITGETTPTIGKKQSAWSRLVSGVQSVWKTVTDALTKPKGDISETTPLTQVTSSGENQTGEKKGRWERFKGFVTSVFSSPKVSETNAKIKPNVSVTTTPRNPDSGNISSTDVKLETRTLEAIRTSSNYVNLSEFEKNLKNNLNDAIRKIGLIQKVNTVNMNDIKINKYLEGLFIDNEYNPLAKNIEALNALKNTNNEQEIQLINSAQREILLHLDKCIQEQDKLINDPVNSEQIKDLKNSRDCLLFVRDKLATDLGFKLPEDVRYISVDKPDQVTRKFVGEKYQQMNSISLSKLSDKDLQDHLQNIHDQLSKDLINIKQKIEENSGKSSPEIKKDLMELHVNLNTLKDQVKKASLQDMVSNHTFQENKGRHFENIKSMEDQARDINAQMLNAEKKDKWQNIASTNLKSAGENLKRSVSDLSESLSKRVGNSPRKSENSSPIDGVSAINPTYEEPPSRPSTPPPTPTTTPTTTPPPTPRNRSFGG